MQARLVPLSPEMAGLRGSAWAPAARRIWRATVLPLVALLLAGCAGGLATPGAVPAPERAEVAALAEAIRGLEPGVDPEEASRAARVAYEYPRQLAVEYQVTDPPLVHNTKVNLGLRPRGLCWHWAEDMEERLEEEDFTTLRIHRAIATPEWIGGDHSTVIISHLSGTMYDGIVLDPWRGAGVLHWMPTLEDTEYAWRPRELVLHEKRKRRTSERRRQR